MVKLGYTAIGVTAEVAGKEEQFVFGNPSDFKPSGDLYMKLKVELRRPGVDRKRSDSEAEDATRHATGKTRDARHAPDAASCGRPLHRRGGRVGDRHAPVDDERREARPRCRPAARRPEHEARQDLGRARAACDQANVNTGATVTFLVVLLRRVSMIAALSLLASTET